MTNFLIRNDDVAYDTELTEIKQFCEICDRYGFKVIQAITPIGECRKSRATMQNEAIRLSSFKRFDENHEVVEFLQSRSDLIGVHGLWHTHEPTEAEIKVGKILLDQLGLTPTYFVPPFNEGDYPQEIAGLATCQLSMDKGERLEDFLNSGTPSAPIMYLHSWRFNNVKYKFKHLENCLKRLTSVTPQRIWYNNWVKKNAKGNVLDIGKSKLWNYGFPTLDTDFKMNSTYVGSIEMAPFQDETFDTVLCNGMYEFVDNPQRMINEVIRITKKGGTAIFGFVGKNYKPYRQPWKCFQEQEQLPAHERIDFGKEYHFLICKKQ